MWEVAIVNLVIYMRLLAVGCWLLALGCWLLVDNYKWANTGETEN